jgi:hypothetical protein
MNINDLNRFTNALLTAYLDDAPVEDLAAICAQFGTTIGSAIFNKAKNRVCEWIDNPDNFQYISPENRDRMIRNALNSEGGVLGVDYSKTAEGYLISPKLIGKFEKSLPAGELDRLRAEGIMKIVNQDPYQMLDEHLGVPFFDSLLSTVTIRVSSLDDAQAGFYLGSMLAGMILAHPWLEAQFGRRLFSCCGTRTAAVIESVRSEQDFEVEGITMLVWDDLLLALGHSETHEVAGESVIGFDELMLLDKVWHSDKMRLSVLADKLRECSR